MSAFQLARIIVRLKERLGPDDLGGESVEELVRRWSKLKSPKLSLAVQEYDPAWPRIFEAEARRIQEALAGEDLVDIQHVGSTAVPPLPGKSVLDLAVAVRTLPCTERQTAALVALGYQPYGPSPIDADFSWFWLIEEGGQHAFVVHVCGYDSPWFSNLINLRDFMRAFPEERQRYENLKRELVAADPNQTWLEYSIVKRVLILRMIKQANAWAAARASSGAKSA